MFKKTGIVVLLFTGLFITSFTPFYSNHHAERTQATPRERKIQKEVLCQIVSFRDYVKDTLFFEVGKDPVDAQKVRQAFLKSRLLFKNLNGRHRILLLT